MARKLSTQVDFKKVKQQVTIVMVLQMLGHLEQMVEKEGGYKGACPLDEHSSPTPFHVDTEKQLWYCHACKEGGNQLELIAEVHGQTFVEACSFAVMFFRLSGVERSSRARRKVRKLPQQPSSAAPPKNELENRPVTDDLVVGKAAAPPDSSDIILPAELAYLRDLDLAPSPAPLQVATNPLLSFALKGIDPHHAALDGFPIAGTTLEAFGAGYYAGRGFLKSRLVFPISNLAGELVAYGGLDLEDGTYLYPKRFHPELEVYNLSAVPDGSDVGVVSEPLDVWQAHDAGETLIVSLLGGSNPGEVQRTLLAQKKAIIESIV